MAEKTKATGKEVKENNVKKKESKLAKIKEVVKKDIGTEEEKVSKKEKSEQKRPKPKKKGTIMERALETLAETREARKEAKKPKFKGLERIYTVPLRSRAHRTKQTKKAVRILQTFVKKHTKAQHVKLSSEVNHALWARSYKKPPHKLRVKVTEVEEGIVEVTLPKTGEK